ncbi:hypothetical protein HZA33_02860 [Candidatus Pacearchaeota archaeon]|nr:hypothetical protein [Candidatus Pacearchaeota archaeon]
MKKSFIFIIIISLVVVASIIAIAISFSSISVNAINCCDCATGLCCFNTLNADCLTDPDTCFVYCGFGPPIFYEGYTCSAGFCVPEFKDYLQMIGGAVVILGVCLFFFRKR